MCRGSLVALCAMGAIATFAVPTAWAGTASMADNNSTAMYVDPQADSNNVTITVVGDRIVFDDTGASSMGAQIPCERIDDDTADCPRDGVARLDLTLGAGDDRATLVPAIAATFRAGLGNDVITSGGANDTVLGEDGNDTLNGGGGIDTLNAGVGDDTLQSGPGNDLLQSGPGNDFLEAPGADTTGNDTLDAGQGDDTLGGGTGPDGGDTFIGGDGLDTASFADRTAAVTLTLDGMPGDGAAGEGDNVGLDIENATGGSAGDRIVGSAGANELRGALGNDSVDGGGGPDIVRTGDGNDEATGGAGDDSVTGGLGNDELEPQGADSSGNDSLDGGEGDDTIRAGTGPNGIDLFIGGTGRDRASFSERRAPLNINLNGQPDDGEQGEGDNIGADVENATGGSANDRMAGSAAANSFSAGGGEDTVDGGAGDDSLDGDAGEDYIDDTLGEDHLIGGDNGDVLRTRDGNRDELDCNAGTDFAVADTRDTADSDCDRVDRDTRHRPVLGSSMVVTPSGGSLGMAPTGITRVVPLKNVVNLPVRSVVDSTAGTIKITSAQRRSRRGRSSQLVRATTASMRFSEAIFQIRQIRASRPATEIRLRGGDFASCSSTAGASGARAAQNRRVIRRLFSRGRGRFRTRGRYSAATVRGTSWVTQDRCDGTLTTVRSGRVAVFDFARRRTVVVRAGRSYLARAARAQIRGG